MESTPRSPEGEPFLHRANALFTRYHEQAAFFILLLWCSLPVIMSIKFLIDGMLGRFPDAEDLLAIGLKLGAVNYKMALVSYQTLFFILGAVTFCFALVCVILCRRRVFSIKAFLQMPWFYLFGALLLWAGISMLHADSRIWALCGTLYMRDGFISYCIYASVFLCASMLRDEKKRKAVLRTFVAAICWSGLIVLIQETTDNAFLNYCFPSSRAAAFTQFNHFGYMLCMAILTCVGLFLYDRDMKTGLRILYLVTAVFLVYILILNNTFGAMLAVLVALPAVFIVYGCSGRKLDMRVVAIVLVLVLLAGVCFFALSSHKSGLISNFTQLKKDIVKIITQAEDAGNAGTNRFGLWLETLDMIKQRPILGFGPEGLSAQNALSDDLLPHNTYLQIAAYLGLVGLFLYLAALYVIARHHILRLRKLDPMVLTASGAAFAYLVSAFVGCPVFNTEPYFWLFLGFVVIAQGSEKPLLCIDEHPQSGDIPSVSLLKHPAAYFETIKSEMAEMSPRTSARPSAMIRMVRSFPRTYERSAYVLLLLWCLLPGIICILYLVLGAVGKFPTTEMLAGTNLSPGSLNYTLAVKVYQILFFILGSITLFFALCYAAICRRQIFSLSSFRQSPWFLLFGLLLLWAIVSSLCSGYFYHAFLGGFYVRDGLASYFIYAAVFLCASCIRREDYRRNLLRVFSAVICFIALIMVIQSFSHSAFLNYCFPSKRAVVFNQFNHFGYILCMAFVCLAGLFLYEKNGNVVLRYSILAGVFFLFYTLVINNTFGAILAAVISVPLILRFYIRSGRTLNMRTATVVLVIFLLAVICFFALSSGSRQLIGNFTQLKKDLIKIITQAEDAGNAGTGRFELWTDTIHRISQRPFLGFGPEGFIGANAITDGKRPHNEYLQIAGYLGIPALLLYLAGLCTLAWHHVRHVKELTPMVLVSSGISIAYLISAIFGNPVYNTAPYFWLFLGLTAAGTAGAPVPQQAEGGRREEARTTLCVRLAVIAFLLLCFGAWLSRYRESLLEREDLRTMQAAEAAAMEYASPSTFKEDVASYYWYDKKNGFLFPSFTTAPEPYGLGSANDAEALRKFQVKNGRTYNYDGSEDYTDKVVLVMASVDPDGNLLVTTAWYTPTQ